MAAHRRSSCWLRWLARSVLLELTNGGYFDNFLGRREPSEPSEPSDFPEPPDTRPSGCSSNVPDVSELEGMRSTIIIPYRSEIWQHMKLTVKSILAYTPLQLIDQILFVSDGTPPERAHVSDLRNMSTLISVLELETAEGLISAKMKAVAQAPKSPVLIFLEPHCRMGRAWLEPLLARLKQQPRALVMPAMDIIPQEKFSDYFEGVRGVWRFEWNLNLIFVALGRGDTPLDSPYPSPATSGGIFAIRRDWWDHLEFYDEGMIGWGGDHLEASHKVWRCGGRVEIVPCSRVGHRFRDPEHRPYDVDVQQVVHNYARFAKVWLDDEYMPLFLKLKPEVRHMELGNLSKQVELRRRLRCHNMTWFLNNIDPEMKWEQSRICIPGCTFSQGICCKHAAAPGRSTIDQVMPADEHLKAMELARKSFAADDDIEQHEL